MSKNLKLNLKLKTGLKQQIEQESTSGGNDKRFLNFYDLKDGEKMEILWVPDVNGELWSKFRKHGPNLKVRGAGAVRCAYESSGEDCPACKKGFEYLSLADETGDKSYKDEAKRWFARDYVLMSCIVLDAPFEVAESPDHNQVKLIWVPYAIENKLKEIITEGVLDEEELCRTPFFIKKTTNAGGYAEYTNSYFGRKEITDEQLEVFADMKVEQFDYTDLDVVPPASSTEEVAEWLKKAEEVVNRAKSGETGGTDQRRETASRQEQSRSEKSKATDDTDGMTEEERTMGEARDESQEQKSSGGFRDRLANLKRR